jgi:alpha-D-xyloside xylohydrolase
MKFTNGFWRLRDGVSAIFAREAYDIEATEHSLVVLAPSKVITQRGDTLNRPLLTVTLTAPLPHVIGVRVEHHTGGGDHDGFDLVGARDGVGVVHVCDEEATLTSGDLVARVARTGDWTLTFERGGVPLTTSGPKSIAQFTLEPGTPMDGPAADVAHALGGPGPQHYVSQQLSLGIGELVYGLGERFGPLVKNGQSVDCWNADGGTSSEQAYKNIPFYLTNRGYGVLVDHPGHVSFEVGSEGVENVQFSVRGERLQYYVIAGGDPAGVLERYTALVGRPPEVPAWSWGLWLSTSFTTDYDEATVMSFIDGMAQRRLPLSVFHFDCFWMREFSWCDFEWDTRVFPDPEGMLARLHDKGLKVCVWINPYIAQRSRLFEEAKRAGYLVRRADGSVWQWDLWQAGMGLVDFTNPEATAWYQQHLRHLLDQGVDTFKTDFGERIPVDVIWHDHSSPERMHNWYTQLYNEAVTAVLCEHAPGEAVVFSRSATVGGHRFPVHWGGDSSSTFPSMAETLRGGLSLAFAGFAYWSHDIGGFEGSPDPAVFKRWVAFGLLSSHSRLHGSDSYRVPWAFDEEAVEVTRRFSELKLSLLPYLLRAGRQAHERGLPVMRPMALMYPDDPAAAYLDRQYLLGDDLLVAPVFDAAGDVHVYLPAGTWTPLLGGEPVTGPVWRRERHGYDSLPLYVRAGAVLPRTERVEGTDGPWLDGLLLDVTPAPAGTAREVEVTEPGGRTATYRVEWTASGATAVSGSDEAWSLRPVGGAAVAAVAGRAEVSW